MRISPIGMMGINISDVQLRKCVLSDIGATHCRDIAIESSYSYCIAIRELIKTGDEVIALASVDKLKMKWFGELIFPKLIEIDVQKEWSKGWCKTAWYYAFSSLALKKCLKDAMMHVVLEKGDTDTDACIVGALIGAKIGYSKRDKECVEIQKIRAKVNSRPVYYHAAVVFDFINYMLYNKHLV